jgi:6-phosphogluconolactonase
MKQRFYVGTKTDQATPSEGIYLYEFDPATARLESLGAVAQTANPTFMTLSADHRFLYSVNELSEFEGQNGGGVSAFAVDSASGKLTLLNSQPTHGQHPCHILLDQTGRWAFASNYTGGSLTIFPVEADGRLGAASSVMQHQGHSIHSHQDAPHVHSTLFDPTHHYLLVSDLGIDQILIYDFDAATGKPHVHDPAVIRTDAGAGPRHMTFHPNGHFFYQINELNGSVGAYRFDSAHGTFTHLQTISTLPSSFHEENAGADIHITPSGKFLYASNRGYDSIAVYMIDAETGYLSLVEWVTENINWPRNFALNRTGEYVLVGNQHNSTIAIFRINAQTGRLTPAGEIVPVPFPVCVLPV